MASMHSRKYTCVHLDHESNLTAMCHTGTNTTAASGLYSGLSTTRNSTVSGAGSAGRYGQLTDGEEVDLDADLELAFSGA